MKWINRAFMLTWLLIAAFTFGALLFALAKASYETFLLEMTEHGLGWAIIDFVCAGWVFLSCVWLVLYCVRNNT